VAAAKPPPDPDTAFAGGCLTLIVGTIFAVACALFGIYRLLVHR